jgi:hypothetical protein
MDDVLIGTCPECGCEDIHPVLAMNLDTIQQVAECVACCALFTASEGRGRLAAGGVRSLPSGPAGLFPLHGRATFCPCRPLASGT